MSKNTRRFEEVNNKKNKEETLLPLRGTKTSAGYDFHTPVDLEIKPGEKVMFFTDVKAKMNKNEVLLLDIRSSMGIKRDLMIGNTIGVIDSDYYGNPDNDGNIGICLRNLKPEMKFDGYTTLQSPKNGSSIVKTQNQIPKIIDLREENTVFIKAGERVAQGIFVKYLSSENCNSEEERSSGIGSTT